MATGPREKLKKLVDANSSSRNPYPRKIPNKSAQLRQFSVGDNNSPQPFDTVASNDSSSFRRNATDISLPGYVQFDNKVRISLNTGSKSVIRELKRKLASELDQVRSLKSRLEATEFHNGSCSNRVGTLARVNSEVSYVGPAETRPLQGLARTRSVDGTSNHYDRSHVAEVDKLKKTPKINQHQKNNESGIGKEKVRSSDDNCKKMMKQCGILLEKLMKHKYGWVFNKPVDAKKLNLHDYHKIIKRPMDLGTVNTKLRKNFYKSPKGFAEDVRLTFNNAMTYNEKGQDAHIMADVLLQLFVEKWAALKAEYRYDERTGFGLDTSKKQPLTSKKKSTHPAPVAEKLNSAACQLNKQLDTKTVVDEGKVELSKKPEEQTIQRREMTFKEKQVLSTQLQSLPSEKLYRVVQIIKERIPGLCQAEDEIELDIDSVDSETLWEIDRLVNDYHTEGSGNVIQAKESGHNPQENNLTSNVVQELEEQHNVNRSCSSGSSSDGSGSSSSDSDSSSSRNCSDTDR